MKYRKPVRVNIGVIVFFIIFIYIVIISVQYLSKEHISIYEVNEKKISDDNTYQGIILRKEKIFYSKNSGYVNYYIGEGNKIGKNSVVYTVDESGQIYNLIAGSETENKITTADSVKIRNDIAFFKNSYENSSFSSKVNNFTYDVANTTSELTNVNRLSQLELFLQENKNNTSFQVVNSKMSGVVSYFIDNMENLTVDKITKDSFAQSEETITQLRSTSAIESGDPVYKLITSENWSVVIPLTKKQYKNVAKKDSIQITFPENNISTNASFSTFSNDGDYFGKVDLNQYMIHFINKRFVEIELNINSANGLKIPVTSITEKDFYLVPLEFFTKGGDSNNQGIVKESYMKNGETEYPFIETDVYFEDDTYGYIDTTLLSPGDWIRNPETQERYEIRKTKSLEGVYNVNKGYSVFRLIEKIYENEEYCIIQKDTANGLSVYDHIVVNANVINEQDIIY